MFLISFLLLLTIGASQSQPEDQSQYVRLGTVLESICLGQADRTDLAIRQAAPGKKGPVGAKGEPGQKGSKGEPVEADYDELQKMISREIHGALDSQSKRISNLYKMLSEANEKISQLNLETGRIKEKMKNNAAEFCPMRHKDKCFWIEVRYSGLTYQQATDICAAQGATPANIYSKEHYYMLLGYLRMLASDDGRSYVWTGMTYNIQTKTVLLSDGSSAPYIKWFSGYPQNNYCCHVTMYAQMDWRSSSNHLYTSKSDHARRGVICEK